MEMCGFSEGYSLNNVNLIKLKNDQLDTIIDFNICSDSKLC